MWGLVFIFLMHLNSNDLFNQIGLVVDQPYSSKNKTHELKDSVFLQIELSEGNHQILEIKHHHDPYQLAHTFCQQHRLNQLAVEIIQRKIIEAKQKEQLNISRQNTQKQPLKIAFPHQKTPKTPSTYHQSRSPLNKQKTRKTIETKNPKINLLPSPIKKRTQKSKDKVQNKGKKGVQNKQRGNDKGIELYGRGMIKMKMREAEYARIRQQKQKSQLNDLTFQPKINEVSAKIVQFRRENGPSLEQEGQKQNKKHNMNQFKSMINIGQQLQECTFKPLINKVSQMIIQNRNTYKDQYDHFTILYKNQHYKKVKTEIPKSSQETELFHPKINAKNYDMITQTFQERLQKSLIRKRQIQQGKVKSKDEYTFQPKIGRAPKENSGITKEGTNRVWWDQLYSHNIKKNHQSKQIGINQSNPQRCTVSQNTNIYYENLVQKRINEVFQALDGNQDGLISPKLISIQNLTKNQLIFMKPLFEQIDELEAVLGYSQFRRALLLLLEQSDIKSRGCFLSSRRKNVQEITFTPEINKKSKEIVCSRLLGGTVHEDLYDKGLKQLQKKQLQMQRQRALQEERQLQDCSFKPMINSSSKYYIEKVLGKRVGLKNDDQSISN